MFTDVTQDELDRELLEEAQEAIQEFMNTFVDNEADALPIDVQIRRSIRARMKH